MAMKFVLAALFPLFATFQIVLSDGPTPTPSSGDESALMNIWNYQIQREVKAMIKYKMQDLAVWEELAAANQSVSTRRYYVTPPAVLIPSSALCQYVAITDSYEVVYDVQLWEKDLPAATVAGLKELGLEIREDQIHPLPFYQARVIWNNPEQQLNGLKLSAAWINNLKQEQVYRFRVAATSNQTCQLLSDTIRKTPDQFTDSIQLQFTVSAAKVDSKAVNIKSEHVTSSELVASLKNLPGVEGDTRYLTSNDYNRMLWEISNQVLVSEVTNGDYVEADDELSLKDLVAQMFQTQKENTVNFDDKMWNSVFWDPLDERPDKITNELNKLFFLNQTDHRAYATGASTSSSSAKIGKIMSVFGGGSGSHSSSSSMTTDDMSHLLEELGVDSEIQGEKFIPKKLDLQRLNMNDLTRQDLFASKRIRVKQVDIGGVLQIGIENNSSSGEAEEENRQLRQRLEKLEEVVKTFDSGFLSLNSTVKILDTELLSLNSTVTANADIVRGSISSLEAKDTALTNDVGILKQSVQSMHIPQCETHQISRRVQPSCPAGKTMQAFILAADNFCGSKGCNTYYYISSFTCC